jgi:5-methylcytosine-specific restriction enzyme subunit McrC
VTCSIKGEDWNIALPGFMFDMNRWFQCLLSKFLNAHLQNYELKDEEVLNEMMKYRAINGAKPKKKVNPRPDFAVFKDKKPVIFLDAKYRDLNEKPLPSNMLYQLAIYAISLQNAPRSAILYPAASKLAKEDLITIHDPSNGNKLAEVFIRPVRLEEFDELLNFTDAKRAQRLNNYAHYLAFGEKNN